MDLERLETTPFETAEPRRRGSGMHVNLRRRTRARSAGQTRRVGASMLVKIGVCAAALLLVLVLEVFVFPHENEAVEAGAEAPAPTDGANTEDVLGRLRFVDGGGLIGVFAGTARWNLPVEASAAALLEDAQLLELEAPAGEVVSISAGGEVRAIGEDPELGAYVRIHHGDDLESVYYHLQDIRVEEGQPLLLGDTLGTVPEDGRIYMRIYQTGAPQEIETYIDVPDIS